MCGIAGFFDPGKKTKDPSSVLKEMTDAITHRGPDDSGYFTDRESGIALGHRRLSILDLSPLGHQPMFSHSGRFVIVYNGEVYNYQEIKKGLEEEGITFKSTTDTEVILEAVEHYGIDKALPMFNGMFAFSLYDKKEGIIYLIRDRVGIKPLYWGINNGILFFASELKAFRRHPLFTASLNIDAIALYLRHNYIPTPYSIYKGVYKLPPGHYLIVDKGLNVRDNTYWDFRKVAISGFSHPFELSETELIERLDDLLTKSVKLRMISDVPLGAFLSGGIDSSTIVALMQKVSNIPQKTFTIGFSEGEYNEARYAADIAKHLGTEHTELYVTPKDAQDVIPKLPDMYDEPFSDSSQIPTHLVSALTRRYVTVSLSGDGGDELFGGYNRYFWLKDIWESVRKVPKPMRKSLSALIRLFPHEFYNKTFPIFFRFLPQKYRFRLPGDKLYKLSEILDKNSPDEMYRMLISHEKYPERIVKNAYEPETILLDKDIKREIPDYVARMMFFDFLTYLPDDILTKVDRASMWVSLEARVPILDHNIVEFAWKVPLKYKIRDGKGKYLLREVLSRYVPRELFERPKTGFGIPIDYWLRGPLKEWAGDLLSEEMIKKYGILEYRPIERMFREHISGRRNWHYYLWDVLMLQSWLNRWWKV